MKLVLPSKQFVKVASSLNYPRSWKWIYFLNISLNCLTFGSISLLFMQFSCVQLFNFHLDCETQFLKQKKKKHFSVYALAKAANGNTSVKLYEMKIFTVTMCNRIILSHSFPLSSLLFLSNLIFSDNDFGIVFVVSSTCDATKCNIEQ